MTNSIALCAGALFIGALADADLVEKDGEIENNMQKLNMETPQFDVDGNVLLLTVDTFHDTIHGPSPVLVDFYAPWCGHCKRLAPNFARAATTLRGQAVLAAVNCEEDRELCEEYGAKTFPTVKLFSPTWEGDMVYHDLHREKNIVSWVIKNFQQNWVEASDEETLRALVASRPFTLVGYFPQLRGAAFDVFTSWVQKISLEHSDVEYAYAVLLDPSLSSPRVTLHTDFEEKRVEFRPTQPGLLRMEELSDWLRWEDLPLIGMLTPKNFSWYHAKKLPVVTLLLDLNQGGAQTQTQPLLSLARKFRGQFVFAWLDASKWETHVARLGVTRRPGVVISDLPQQRHYPLQQEISVASVEDHCDLFLARQLQPHLRNQNRPLLDEGEQILHLTQQSFEEKVAFRGVTLVFFDAPWCKECRGLRSVYPAVAEELSAEDHIQVATLDVSVNDAPFSVPTPLPVVMLFGLGGKQVYHGDHAKGAVVDFLRGKLSDWEDARARGERTEL